MGKSLNAKTILIAIRMAASVGILSFYNMPDQKEEGVNLKKNMGHTLRKANYVKVMQVLWPST
jgi:hypothetical protein